MKHRLDRQKRLVAQTAAELVEDGMTIGLGSGSTVAHLIEALAIRKVDARYVASSPATESSGLALGLRIEAFRGITTVDLAIDGADQVRHDFWLIKGGGAAHTREKIVAASAERFVVIVDSSKLVAELQPPVPLELMQFGLDATVSRLGRSRRRNAPLSPDGGVIADLYEPISDPSRLAARLDACPGVVEHGLFPPDLVTNVMVGEDRTVRYLERGSPL